jgi:hypothetical protein
MTAKGQADGLYSFFSESPEPLRSFSTETFYPAQEAAFLTGNPCGSFAVQSNKTEATVATFYIDESGEEGFSTTSSEWFILGGVAHTRGAVDECAARYDAFKTEYNKESNWYFHFQKKSHDERVGFIRWMRETQYVGFSIAVHKPSLVHTDRFQKKYYLYFYALRLLLEKATYWTKHAANEPMLLYLSSRRGLRKEDLQDYFFRVQNSPHIKQDKIVWDHLVHDDVRIQDNKSLRGLQMADCVASSVAKALEYSGYGNTERRYIDELSPILYRYPNSIRHAIKLWPDPSPAILKQPRFEWLYGK